MKYILSYASNPAVSSERNGLFSRELVDSSVRNLLHELGAVCSGVPTGNVPSSGHQFSGRDGQSQRPLGQNIEMKRGDWICPKYVYLLCFHYFFLFSASMQLLPFIWTEMGSFYYQF